MCKILNFFYYFQKCIKIPGKKIIEVEEVNNYVKNEEKNDEKNENKDEKKENNEINEYIENEEIDENNLKKDQDFGDKDDM